MSRDRFRDNQMTLSENGVPLAKFKRTANGWFLHHPRSGREQLFRLEQLVDGTPRPPVNPGRVQRPKVTLREIEGTACYVLPGRRLVIRSQLDAAMDHALADGQSVIELHCVRVLEA